MIVVRSLIIVGLALGSLGFGVEDAWAEVEVLRGPNFLVLDGASGVEGCLPRDLAKRTVRDRVLDANAETDIDPTFGVVFSIEVPPCADLFYAAVSNDVSGIGYQHFYEEELFDDSPGAALEGVAFLNDIPYWDAYPDELTRAFLHELGHRWGVRVRVAGEDPTALLGRDLEHWSYFLDTSSAQGVSPLEGNVWLGEGPNFSSGTEGAAGVFSDFDLYLMGLLPPDEVPPVRLLTPAEGVELPTDCGGGAVQPGSPPQRCDPIHLAASATTYSIEDVIAVEGPRVPSASAERQERSIAFYFVTLEGRWTGRECEHWRDEVERLTSAVEDATGGRLVLSNAVSGGWSCDELLAELAVRHPEPTVSPRSNGCSHSRRAGDVPAWSLLCAAALGVSRLRRARRALLGQKSTGLSQ